MNKAALSIRGVLILKNPATPLVSDTMIIKCNSNKMKG